MTEERGQRSERATEARAGELELDLLPAAAVVDAVLAAHDGVVAVVRRAGPAIAALARETAGCLADGGRVIYVGAGSAGRIAALDASEWGPTFSVPDGTVLALVAGARHPPGSAAEAEAEDDAAAGRDELRRLDPAPPDVVVALTAGGRTPYALGALAAAREAGALTALVTSVEGAAAAELASHRIVLPVGPEPLAGSTRLKAATAQKLVLNAFSTATMALRGRVLGDLMAGMRVANEKLRERAVRVGVATTSASAGEVRAALNAAADRLDVSLVMLAGELSAPAAAELLAAHGGHIRDAVAAAVGRREST